jgi:hypothetical protein
MDFQAFLSALMADWVSLMSGIVSVVLLIVGSVRKWDTMPRWAIWTAAAVCFFFASVRVWTTEHRAYIKVQSQIQELTQPKLRLTIDELGVGQRGKKSITSVLVIANLTNDGAPSIADTWSLKAILTDGRTKLVGTIYIDPTKPISGSSNVIGPNWKMSPDDALYIKAASKSIQRGDKVRGVLLFDYDAFTVEEMSKIGTKFELRCSDVKNTIIEQELTFDAKRVPFQYYPGLSPIPH